MGHDFGAIKKLDISHSKVLWEYREEDKLLYYPELFLNISFLGNVWRMSFVFVTEENTKYS